MESAPEGRTIEPGFLAQKGRGRVFQRVMSENSACATTDQQPIPAEHPIGIVGQMPHRLDDACSFRIFAIVDRATRWPRFLSAPWIRV
jgi:hypothetical protein